MIKMYGTTWCGDCHRARRVLDEMQEAYQWLDVDKDVEARQHLVGVVGKVKRAPGRVRRRYPHGGAVQCLAHRQDTGTAGQDRLLTVPSTGRMINRQDAEPPRTTTIG